MVRADLLLFPSLTCNCSTSTSTPLVPFGIRRLVSHQLIRSNHLTGSAPTAHSLPRLSTAVGVPLLSVCTMTCSIPASYARGPTMAAAGQAKQKPRCSAGLAVQRGFVVVGPTGIEPMTSTV